MASALSSAEREALVANAAQLGVDLGAAAVEHCAIFLDLLVFWNRSVNLVGDKDREALIVRHIVDSMAAAPLIRDAAPRGAAIADLGSGAGLPGVPLAITLPEARLTLFEARRKRAHFLRAVARALPGLRLEIVAQRNEQSDSALRESFDVVVSRATFGSGEFLRAARPLLRPTGIALAYKGTSAPLALAASCGDPAFTPALIRPYTLGRRPAGRLELWRLRST
jgi:16S rRNA (guanine527-N7)-methyltransferase